MLCYSKYGGSQLSDVEIRPLAGRVAQVLLDFRKAVQPSSSNQMAPSQAKDQSIHATADLTSGRLETLDATPHILPFRECPSAVAAARTLAGSPINALRDVVLERLARTDGCTHLNDALRALAEVPVLIRELKA